MNLYHLDDLSGNEIINLVKKGITFKKNKFYQKCDKTIATLFFEPSTRTQLSFEMACNNLGYKVLNLNVGNSSLNKGETMLDTVKTIEAMGVDGFVIRSEIDCYYDDLESIKVPILNAGDGKKDHPTQVLLDLMTIYEEFGYFKGLNIVIAGDIKHSRVANTNYKALKKLGADVILAAPKGLEGNYGEYVSIDDVIQKVDICMMLRCQNERHDQISYDINEIKLNRLRYEKLKDNAIIMHPGPFNRDVEIMSDVVYEEKSRILEQVKNGVYMRMVVLDEYINQKC